MKIIPLSEGAFTVDKTKKFLHFDKGKDDLQQRETGSLLVEVQPFVVVTTEDILLFDTGLGFEHNGIMQIHQNLVDAGIEPSKISKVLMSHLHKDHSGGLSKLNINSGKRELAFPDAVYYVQKRELEFAFEKSYPSYIIEDLECLKESNKVVLLDGDTVIDGYIKCEVTGAHCPYHQVFLIVDGGEKIFFGGDVAPQLQQMKSRFVAKYDYDGKKSMELRQQWWKQGHDEKWRFLFYHDIRIPVYQN
ncbi:MAG: MBL fold metallo-hydrolase [Bacteroidetes bacterium]|nr:MBL fold metallo-hydrolase [Bacteroidota bacterium]MBS1972743.1 MBL fold metallo-hydrolase [Bacteroidota bacterium]